MTAHGNWPELWNPLKDGGEEAEQFQTSLSQWSEKYRKFINVIEESEPEIGLTPREVIWRKNKSKLYRFSLPGVSVTKHTPVFMVYAMINKPFILDVEPGNSFVESLLKAGYDVYMLDWGEAGPEDRNLGFADYILDYLKKAVDRVCLYTERDKVNLLAYCMGGTMGVMYTALFPDRVKNLMVLAGPVDFRYAVLYNKWLDEKTFDVDKLVETFGNVPSPLIDFGNKMLKPLTNYVNPWIHLFDKIDNDTFVHNWRVLNKWVNDGTDFPGQTYREWIRDFYQHNKLIQGEIVLRGHPVDLAKIQCPVLILTAEHDHIAPRNQTRALLEYISSADKEEHNYPVGHVSLVFGGTARKRVYPETIAWLDPRD